MDVVDVKYQVWIFIIHKLGLPILRWEDGSVQIIMKMQQTSIPFSWNFCSSNLFNKKRNISIEKKKQWAPIFLFFLSTSEQVAIIQLDSLKTCFGSYKHKKNCRKQFPWLCAIDSSQRHRSLINFLENNFCCFLSVFSLIQW